MQWAYFSCDLLNGSLTRDSHPCWWPVRAGLLESHFFTSLPQHRDDSGVQIIE